MAPIGGIQPSTARIYVAGTYSSAVAPLDLRGSEIRNIGPKVRLGYKPQSLTLSPCLRPPGSITSPAAPPTGRQMSEHIRLEGGQRAFHLSLNIMGQD